MDGLVDLSPDDPRAKEALIGLIGSTFAQLKEIDKTRIQSNLTLVRVDVPHAIIMREKPRWAISIRLKGNIKTWDKIVEMFQILNLLDKR